jgi:hypothetical protein
LIAFWIGILLKEDRMQKTSNKVQTIPQVHTEYDGHICEANQWFKLGLSRAEIAALKKIRERFYQNPKNKKLAAVLRALVLTSIAHFAEVHPIMYNDYTYAQKEGFGWPEIYQDELIIRRFQLKPSKGSRWS